MKPLTDSQHRILAALAAGAKAHFMSGRGDTYWFLSTSHEHCSAQIGALLERKLVALIPNEYKRQLKGLTSDGIAYLAAHPYVAKSETLWHLQFSGPSITQTKVDKVTDAFVTINGRRHSRSTDYDSYHLTHEDAAKALIRHFEAKLTSAQSRVKWAQEELNKARKVAAS